MGGIRMAQSVYRGFFAHPALLKRETKSLLQGNRI